MSEGSKHQARIPFHTLADAAPTVPRMRPTGKRRANNLDGAMWTRYSISIWSDIKKTPEEIALGHPAIFPRALVTRLIECFASEEDQVVLDPFVGIGSTAIAAQALGKVGIGIEINPTYAEKARARPLCPDMLSSLEGDAANGKRIIYAADARNLLDYVEGDSVDLVITSPPYWDILLQERTADYKSIRHYGDTLEDLGKVADYTKFLGELRRVFSQVYDVLRPQKYCIIVVMDIRKKDRFYPFHADTATFMQEIGFQYDDLIIWDRRHEYNNMRPLGYPFRFRVNKAHEFILIFRKPS